MSTSRGDTPERSRRYWLKAASVSVAAGTVAACGKWGDDQSACAASDVREWALIADVIVVGSGAAGTCAAIEARAAGCDVLVLEMLDGLGGATGMSDGVVYLGGGTPIQKACGFEDSVEDMYQYIVAAGPVHPHQDKVQLYCESSLEHFAWLVKHGVPFTDKFFDDTGLPMNGESLYYSGNELVYPFREMSRPAPRGHVTSGVGGAGGHRLMEALLASAGQLGVVYKNNQAVKRLVQASDGRVLGVMLEQDGKPIYYRAKRGVVLAAGGFVHNRDMVKLFAPELHDISVPWGSAGDQGLGILMGMGAGAAAIRMNQALIGVTAYPPANVLKGIIVNAHGQRYMPEESYYCLVGHETAVHQRGQAWLITDADSAYPQEDTRLPEVAKANFLEELETQLKIPQGALLATTNYYNEYAKYGEDPLFQKHPRYIAPLIKPPFRAYDLNISKASYPHLTCGGLHTRNSSQVVSIWGDDIGGLYAAGRTASGLPAAPCIGNGISVGDATFFGRQAGKSVASNSQA
jgi:3-oxo-5alpha-steroid 4-dehydrogenase